MTDFNLHPRLAAILGPTNTGKTHYAVERMMAHTSGIIGFPLRLLAREVYDRVAAVKGASRVALITGEEKIQPPFADYTLCTVESMPLAHQAAFVAVDEIQMCADPERGHVFTDRLLRARGREETLFLGAETMRPLIRALVPGIEFVSRPRLSNLRHVPAKKLSRLPRRSALVAFSADDVYRLAEILRRTKGGAAIVMGALSPRTRNAQVALYQSGEVDYLVATDAIGMGLNMDIDHVAFASTRKYDGRSFRSLSAAELGQIAGRAGRHMSDGSFSTITDFGDAPLGLDAEMVDRIENHRFAPLERIYWRECRLDFASPEALIAALERRPTRREYWRADEASDLHALKTLAKQPEIRKFADHSERVEWLWNACQIPDFRKISAEAHARLIGRIFLYLVENDSLLPEDWIAREVERLDNAAGDIDTLAARIAGIRIWTYVSQRPGWLARPDHWAAETRRIEDGLSDALHQALMQRFVNRRTAMLMRDMRARGEMSVAIEPVSSVEGPAGDDIRVEGERIGRLDGFTFEIDPIMAHDEHKALRAAAEHLLRAEITRRVGLVAAAGDGEFTLDLSHGPASPRIKWRGVAIANLGKGHEILSPRVTLIPGSLLDGPLSQAVLERCEAWAKAQIAALLDPLVRIRDLLKVQKAEDVALNGTARGIAYRLVETLGMLPRGPVEEEVRSLDQPSRKALRLFGIRFGSSYIFMPALLKPAPTDWRLMLWALNEAEGANIPPRPTPGMVWTPVFRDAAKGFYRILGFKVAGMKAVRIDMLERLADAVRPLGQAGKPFTVTPEIMGLIGLSGEDFAAAMQTLGYGNRQMRPEELAPAAKPAEIVAEAVVETPAEVAVEAPEAPAEVTVETPAEPILLTAFIWQPKRKRPQQKPAEKPIAAAKTEARPQRRRPEKPAPAPKPAPVKSKPIPAHSPFAALSVLKERMKS